MHLIARAVTIPSFRSVNGVTVYSVSSRIWTANMGQGCTDTKFERRFRDFVQLRADLARIAPELTSGLVLPSKVFRRDPELRLPGLQHFLGTALTLLDTYSLCGGFSARSLCVHWTSLCSTTLPLCCS